ncbi:hypothetical protein D3C85_1501830 [compost metagenome]
MKWPHREQARSHKVPGVPGVCGYSVNVSRFTSAPGNNADAVARWLYVLADSNNSRSWVNASSCEPSRLKALSSKRMVLTGA